MHVSNIADLTGYVFKVHVKVYLSSYSNDEGFANKEE